MLALCCPCNYTIAIIKLATAIAYVALPALSHRTECNTKHNTIIITKNHQWARSLQQCYNKRIHVQQHLALSQHHQSIIPQSITLRRYPPIELGLSGTEALTVDGARVMVAGW
jgi:hypothetical protein